MAIRKKISEVKTEEKKSKKKISLRIKIRTIPLEIEVLNEKGQLLETIEAESPLDISAKEIKEQILSEIDENAMTFDYYILQKDEYNGRKQIDNFSLKDIVGETEKLSLEIRPARLEVEIILDEHYKLSLIHAADLNIKASTLIENLEIVPILQIPETFQVFFEAQEITHKSLLEAGVKDGDSIIFRNVLSHTNEPIPYTEMGAEKYIDPYGIVKVNLCVPITNSEMELELPLRTNGQEIIEVMRNENIIAGYDSMGNAYKYSLKCKETEMDISNMTLFEAKIKDSYTLLMT